MLSRRLFLTLPAALSATDFPQWRGPNRDGILAPLPFPASLPDQLTLKWRITVGEGHASPVAAAGRLFVFARQGDAEILRAVDPTSGKILWTTQYNAPYTVNPAATKHRKGPKSTPIVAGSRIFTLGISGILSAYELSSGKLLWRKEFADQFRHTSPLYGAAMSPIVAGGLLIVHLGGDGNGALTAFDAASGALRWSWKEDGPAYASPILATLNGIPQIVTQTERHILSVRLASGEPLWKLPFTTPYAQNSVTPLLHHDKLILSGLSNGTLCLDATGKTLWHNKDVGMYMSSPVASGDTLYGFTNRNRGQYFAMSTRDGKLLWTSEPRQGENASLLLAANLLFLLNNQAELILATPSPEKFQPLKTYSVASSETWAHPLPSPHGIFIKDFDSLTLWTL
jgi:outer membrane protein assembly factor BamB